MNNPRSNPPKAQRHAMLARGPQEMPLVTTSCAKKLPDLDSVALVALGRVTSRDSVSDPVRHLMNSLPEMFLQSLAWRSHASIMIKLQSHHMFENLRPTPRCVLNVRRPSLTRLLELCNVWRKHLTYMHLRTRRGLHHTGLAHVK